MQLESILKFAEEQAFPFEDMTFCVTRMKVKQPKAMLNLWDKICEFFGFMAMREVYRFTLWKYIDGQWYHVANRACEAEPIDRCPNKDMRLQQIYESLKKAYEAGIK